MESCFSCFTVNVLVDLRVIAVATERRRLVLLNPIPTAKPTPLLNAATNIPPVMMVDMIRPVSSL